MRKKSVLIGIFFLFLSQAMVSINIVFAKLLIGSLPIFLLLFLRFGIASLIVLPFYWTHKIKGESIHGHLKTFNRKDWFYHLVQALCPGLIFNFLMLSGLHYTDANIAAIITSGMPSIIVVMAWIFLQDSSSLNKLLCVGITTMGLIIIAVDKYKIKEAYHSLWGDTLIFLSLIPEAIYYLNHRFYQSKLPVFLNSSLVNALNALFILPLLFLIPYEWTIPSLREISYLLLIGSSSSFFYVFWSLGSCRVDNTLSSLSTALMPIITVFLAYEILNEQLGMIGVCQAS